MSGERTPEASVAIPAVISKSVVIIDLCSDSSDDEEVVVSPASAIVPVASHASLARPSSPEFCEDAGSKEELREPGTETCFNSIQFWCASWFVSPRWCCCAFV